MRQSSTADDICVLMAVVTKLGIFIMLNKFVPLVRQKYSNRLTAKIRFFVFVLSTYPEEYILNRMIFTLCTMTTICNIVLLVVVCVLCFLLLFLMPLLSMSSSWYDQCVPSHASAYDGLTVSSAYVCDACYRDGRAIG